jgi:DNA-binding transcriptional MerR regulator
VTPSNVIIPEKLFFKIGEVCDLLDVQAHVLRYWETEFPMFAPQKNRAGQRTYRRRDVEMALRIKELLYDEKYTIAGAKQKLSSDMRGVNRENGMSARPKAPTRSLQPPPSLAAKFGPLQSAENAVEEPKPNAAPSNDQRTALREIAKELREILDLLDEGEQEIAARMSEEV